MTVRPEVVAIAGRGVVRRCTAAAVFLAAGCVSGELRAPRAAAAERSKAPVSFVDPSTLDPKLPTPGAVLGHVIGQRAVRYEPMVRYLQLLAEASPWVTITPYATSHEGRTLYYLTISSEKNLARLDAIRAENAKLADPRLLADDAEAERIVESLPGVAWMAYSIHGDELSSTDAAVQLAYQLAAGTDEATRQLREELVIHIDPLMNPDGRERYLSQLEPLAGKVPNADVQAMQHTGMWSAGRGNHYLFDLNRDWLMQVHPETRGRAAKIIEWNPHLVVDSHEMGSLDTYLFDPPREPLNPNLAGPLMEWRRRFSEEQAKAFDRFGWSYYTREWYEEWYPGYTNAWASLQGAIGILYEQAGVNAAAVRQETGETLTYQEAVHHHLTSSLANLESLRTHRKQILRDYLADKRWAVAANGPATEAFLVPSPADRALFARFAETLSAHGLELGFATGPFQANVVVDTWGARSDSRTMPEGTLVVRGSQPRRRLLHALLDFDPRMTDSFLTEERKDIENRRGSRVYDITAWNLSMAYGLEAFWAASVGEVLVRTGRESGTRVAEEPPGYGYLIDGASSDVYAVLVRLLEAGCKPRVAVEPFSFAGRAFEPGTVLLRRHENPEDLGRHLKTAVDGLKAEVLPAGTALSEKGPDLGGQRFRLLHPPRIAIASQWPIATTSFGSLWYLLDGRLGLRSSPINFQAMGMMDLRKYNVLVLPDAWSGEGMAAILDEGARKKLRSWVEGGGTLVAIGGSAAFLADKDRGLSAVRVRQDVLDQLAVYEEAVKQEQSARRVRVDAGDVWARHEPAAAPLNASAQPAAPRPTEGGPKPPPPDVEALKREDAWWRLFSPNGAVVTAALNPEHWLCFGLTGNGPPDRMPVLLSGAHAFMSKFPVETPVRLVKTEELRLSGLLWPEARGRWGNTAYAMVERVGNGQIILFASDPFFRGYFEGSGRLFLNAVILGPGAGASQPLPW